MEDNFEVLERAAKLLEHAIVYSKPGGPVATKQLWNLWQGIVEASGVSLSEACRALYEAQGQSLIFEYIDTCHFGTPWLICSGCETQTPRDADDGACLVCGGD